jgi:hypothetical protein
LRDRERKKDIWGGLEERDVGKLTSIACSVLPACIAASLKVCNDTLLLRERERERGRDTEREREGEIERRDREISWVV